MRYLFDSDPEKPKTEIAMHYIREEVIAGHFLAGVWRCNLASSSTTENGSRCGL